MKRYTIVPGNESYAQWSSYLSDIQSNIFSLVDYVNLFQTPYQKKDFTTFLCNLGFREYILNSEYDKVLTYYIDTDELTLNRHDTTEQDWQEGDPALRLTVKGRIGYYVSLVQPFPYDIPETRKQEGLVLHPITWEEVQGLRGSTYELFSYALCEAMPEKPADWETNYASYYTSSARRTAEQDNDFVTTVTYFAPISEEFAIYNPYFPNLYYHKDGDGKFIPYTDAVPPEQWYTNEFQSFTEGSDTKSNIYLPRTIEYKRNTSSTWLPYTYYREVPSILPHPEYVGPTREGSNYWYARNGILPSCYLFIPFSEGSCYALSINKKVNETIFNFEIGSDPLRNVAVNTMAQSDCRFDFETSYSPVTTTFSIPTSNGVDFIIKDPRGMALMTKGQNGWIQLYDEKGEELFCDSTLRTDIENLSSGDFLVYNITAKSTVAPYFPKTVKVEVF